MKKTTIVSMVLLLAILLSSGCSLAGKGSGLGDIDLSALSKPSTAVPGQPTATTKTGFALATPTKAVVFGQSSSQVTASSTNCSGVYLDKWAILYDDLNQRWSDRAVTMLDGEILKSITPANPTDPQKFEATFWVLMAAKILKKVPGDVNRISGYCLPLPENSKDAASWAVITYWALVDPKNAQLLSTLQRNGLTIESVNADPWINRTREQIFAKGSTFIETYVPRIAELARGG